MKAQEVDADTTLRKISLAEFSATDSSTATTTLQADSLQQDSTKNKMLEYPVDYKAEDSIVVELDSEMMRMYNQSQVQYEEQQIDAYSIEVDMPKNLVYAKYGLDSAENETGFPVFKDKQSEYEVREMYYNIKTKKAFVKDIITKEGEGYIRSGVSKRVTEDTYYLKDGMYTTCDQIDNPHYAIKLKRAKYIKEDKVVSGWANLVIEGVETPIALPFGLFPMKKHYSSGILMPTFGEEKTRGFYFKDFGYYWAVNDFFDLKATGTIYTHGSWGTEISSNYKKRYKYNGRFGLSYNLNKYGDEGLDDYQKVKDFALRWTHSQDSKAHPYRTLSASVNISSSENDYNNARSVNNIVNTTKQSSISYSRRWPNSPFNLSLALQHSQNRRDTTISLTLPKVSFSMQPQYPFRRKNKAGRLKWYDKIKVGYSANFSNSIKTKEDQLFKADLKDWRNGFQHSIPISTSYKLARDLTFSMGATYKGVAYLNSIRKSYDPIADKVITDTISGFNYAQNFTTSTSLSFSPKFYGMYNFKKDSKIKAIRHVISPSVSFSYTPDLGLDNDALFRTYNEGVTDEEVRYSILSSGIYGFPTKGTQAGNIRFSLDNNIEMKVRDDGKDEENLKTGNESSEQENESEFKKIKLLESFRLSTSYNIFADSMKFSNISLSGRTSLFNKKMKVQLSGTIDPYALNEKGKRINRFAGGLGRLTAARLSLGTSFSGKSSKKGKNDNKRNDTNDEIAGGDEVFNDGRDVEAFNDIDDYVDFNIPWSVNVNYNFTYTKPRFTGKTSQYIRLSGNLSLTEKWKVSFNTGYDFTQKDVSTTSFSVFRDLHCWEMSFSAIPFGSRQSYSFRIAIKSSMLKDLKYQKKDSWYDNF